MKEADNEHHRPSKTLFIVVCMGMLVTLVARGAAACPNVTRLEVDQDVRNVARAEKELANEEYAKARRDLALVRQWESFIHHSTKGANDNFFHAWEDGRKDPNVDFIPVALRAYRLFALLAVRDPSSTAAEKTLARETMLDFVRTSQDPTMAIDAAEVFSHSDDMAPVALMMLRSYADKISSEARGLTKRSRAWSTRKGTRLGSPLPRERCRRMPSARPSARAR